MFDFIMQIIDYNFRRSSSIHLSVYLLKRYFYTIFLVFHNMIVIHKSSWNPSECSVHLFSLLLSGLKSVFFSIFFYVLHVCVPCIFFFSLFLTSGFSSSKCRGEVPREESSNFMRARRFSRFQRASLIQGENISLSILDFQKLPLKQENCL